MRMIWIAGMIIIVDKQMRENIKFKYRIKNKKTKEVQDLFLRLIDIECLSSFIDETKFEIIAREEFSGFITKDKKEIYEGDKLKVVLFTVNNKVEVYEGEVIFESASFSLRIDKVINGVQYDAGQTPPLYEFQELETIGDIHKNKSTDIIIEN